METGRRIHHSAIQTAVPIAKDCAGVKVPVSAKAVNAKLAGPARISNVFFMRPPWVKRGGGRIGSDRKGRREAFMGRAFGIVFFLYYRMLYYKRKTVI